MPRSYDQFNNQKKRIWHWNSAEKKKWIFCKRWILDHLWCVMCDLYFSGWRMQALEAWLILMWYSRLSQSESRPKDANFLIRCHWVYYLHLYLLDERHQSQYRNIKCKGDTWLPNPRFNTLLSHNPIFKPTDHVLHFKVIQSLPLVHLNPIYSFTCLM